MKLRSSINHLANYGNLGWEIILKFFRGFYEGQHQLTSTTAFNRYPDVFSEVKNVLDARTFNGTGRMLSFGCSTGEECFSLRHYFPHAPIIGADINKKNIAKAKAANTDKNISFIVSEESAIEAEGPYEVIFCLSVLCRWNDTEFVDNCEAIYPFKKFDQTVGFLSDNLSSGGLLVIYNSNFRFEDSSIIGHYSPLDAPSVSDSGFVHKFDSRNKKIRQPHRTVIYQKL